MYLRKSDVVKKIRGVVVWDFDGVLFRTADFVRDIESVFRKYHIPIQVIPQIVVAFKHGEPFSIARVARVARERRILFPIRAIQKDIRHNLLKCRYVDPLADRVLHRLSKMGFVHMILSFGSTSFQYRKINIGCGRTFRRHFVKVKVTSKEKYPFLRSLRKEYPTVPIFFVDDTKEHIDLVKQHVPDIVAIHFTKRDSLKDVEKRVNTYNHGREK